MRPDPDPNRLPRGFRRLLLAQALSALADHALLIVAIARLAELGAAAWLAPLLKFGFTAAYVLLAPLAGALADASAKPRVMRRAQALKLAGVAALCAAGSAPGVLAAYALAGLGAALHSPAKYGWVSESTPPPALVRANGWLEAGVVVAALAGAVLGGLLLGLGGGAGGPEASALGPALGLLLALQALALLAHAGLPDPPGVAARPRARPAPGRLLRRFRADTRRLARDPQASTALAVTALAWGAGGALQFLVLRWGQERLGLGLDGAAALQGLVGLGVILGAVAAGRAVTLQATPRLLPLGLLLGALPTLMVAVEGLALGLPLLVAVGALAGLLIVPMNALLQARGRSRPGPGRTVAVQNGAENLGMALALALSSAATAAGLGLKAQVLGLGLLLVLGVAGLMRRARPHPGRIPAALPAPAARGRFPP